MRRASWRIREPRNASSSTSRRYALDARCFSMAGRPRNSVRRSSASAPRLTSTRRDARRPRKTFHRLVHRVADDQTETGDAPHPSRQPGRSTGVATNAGGALARRDPREAPRRDGRIPAGERSRGLRCRAPEWGARGVRGGDDPPHADGCDTSPVGYVEGWYVDADVRRHGDGRRLIRTAERWARERGCTEMGSDCLLENEVSLRAHLAIGYEERERLIHFRRWLARPVSRPRS